jgi:hypothetical protein
MILFFFFCSGSIRLNFIRVELKNESNKLVLIFNFF